MGASTAIYCSFENEFRWSMTLNNKMYWPKGQTEVEVLKTGHYPTTAIVRLPSGKETEVDIMELEDIDG